MQELREHKEPINSYMIDAAATHAITLMNQIGDRKAARLLGLERSEFYRIVSREQKLTRALYLQILKIANDFKRRSLQNKENKNVNFN